MVFDRFFTRDCSGKLVNVKTCEYKYAMADDRMTFAYFAMSSFFLQA